MKQLMNRHRILGWSTLAAALLVPGSTALHEDGRWLSLPAAAVEALEMPYSEEDILKQIARQFGKTESALFIRAREFQVRASYDGWKTTKQELALMAGIKANLDAAHRVDVLRQREAEIEDTAVLESHTRVLEKEIALLQKRAECRSHLLRILELANVQIIGSDITSGDY